MGRRRRSRRRRIIVRKKTLPKVFSCPNCDSKTVSINVKKAQGKVVVLCGTCGLQAEYDYNPIFHPVDYYNKFIDDFYEGKLSIPSRPSEGEIPKLQEVEEVESEETSEVEE